jgi:hypothetical protein
MKTKNLVLVTILYLLYLLVARIPILSLKNVFFYWFKLPGTVSLSPIAYLISIS